MIFYIQISLYDLMCGYCCIRFVDFMFTNNKIKEKNDERNSNIVF